LRGNEKALRPDHTLTLGTINNLSLLRYKRTGDIRSLEEAI
jgi:hypothetical protein